MLLANENLNGKVKIAMQQLLRNPDIQPTSDVISEALGEAYGAYTKFVCELERHDIQLVWHYYTDGKAWLAKGLHTWTGARGGQNQTTAFWLSIWDGFFKVTIYVPQKARADLLNLPLDDETKQIIANSNILGEKLKFFPLVFELNSEKMLESVYTLADFRKSIK